VVGRLDRISQQLLQVRWGIGHPREEGEQCLLRRFTKKNGKHMIVFFKKNTYPILCTKIFIILAEAPA
jgi:hypothetical protein